MGTSGFGSGSSPSLLSMKMWLDPIGTRYPHLEESISEPQVESLMQSFPRRLLVICPAMNPSMSCKAPSKISTPACAGPTVGATSRGKVTADFRRVELDMGPLL